MLGTRSKGLRREGGGREMPSSSLPKETIVTHLIWLTPDELILLQQFVLYLRPCRSLQLACSRLAEAGGRYVLERMGRVWVYDGRHGRSVWWLGVAE